MLAIHVTLLLSISLQPANPPRDLEPVPLWPNGAPGAKGNTAADIPTLIPYLLEGRENRPAVVICPGGGYGGLAMSHEGHEIAAWLNRNGIHAFICNYRHRGKGYGHPYPLMDAQRAIRIVRGNSTKWKVEPDRVGILGFSAGGHLASSSATHDSIGKLDASDPLNGLECRPDFAVLCYAVIGFGKSYTHRGSQRNLLGKNPAPDLIRFYSNENRVDKKTCPTFLWHTAEDRSVPAENSVRYFLQCQKHGVPSSLHVFEKGRHGIGLAKSTPAARKWPDLCISWLSASGFIAPDPQSKSKQP